MGAIASQITSLTIVYSTVYSDADERKYQSSASRAFVRGIHRRPVNSPHKWPVTRKMFPFDDVIMYLFFVGVKILRVGTSLWKEGCWDTERGAEVCTKCGLWPMFQPSYHRRLRHLCKSGYCLPSVHPSKLYCVCTIITATSMGVMAFQIASISTVNSTVCLCIRKRNVKAYVTGPLWWESTSEWRIPFTKGQ